MAADLYQASILYRLNYISSFDYRVYQVYVIVQYFILLGSLFTPVPIRLTINH